VNYSGSLLLIVLQLWEQLQLLVSLSIPTRADTGLGADVEDITLDIGVLQGITRPDPHDDETVLSSSSSSSSSHNACQAIPPDGVPLVAVQTVWIRLDFMSPLRPQKRKLDAEYCPRVSRSRPSLQDQGFFVRHGIKYAPTDRLNLNPDSTRLSQHAPFFKCETFPSLELAELQDNNSRRSPLISSSGVAGPSQWGEQHNIEPAIFLEEEEPAQFLEIIEEGPILHPHEQSFAAESHNVMGMNGHVNHINNIPGDKCAVVQLTNAAFRSLLVGHPDGHTTGGLIVTRRPDTPSLSAIAPAMWSPGYLRASFFFFFFLVYFGRNFLASMILPQIIEMRNHFAHFDSFIFVGGKRQSINRPFSYPQSHRRSPLLHRVVSRHHCGQVWRGYPKWGLRRSCPIRRHTPPAAAMQALRRLAHYKSG
jgi:hypothetical protein